MLALFDSSKDLSAHRSKDPRAHFQILIQYIYATNYRNYFGTLRMYFNKYSFTRRSESEGHT